ncbi:hypothetical protein B0H11DRAFT_1914920 [Mycena galericulata]|nr:hypothetical protein B0H11DRAFT_1914920 [Mycena galericulata]
MEHRVTAKRQAVLAAAVCIDAGDGSQRNGHGTKRDRFACMLLCPRYKSTRSITPTPIAPINPDLPSTAPSTLLRQLTYRLSAIVFSMTAAGRWAGGVKRGVRDCRTTSTVASRAFCQVPGTCAGFEGQGREVFVGV